MEIEELLASLVRDLELAGEADAEALIARWFQAGESLTGPVPLPPEPVQEVEAAGPEENALFTKAGHLQTLMVVVTGARAELEQAQDTGDTQAQARLVKALAILVAMTEQEDEAIREAIRARSN